MCAGDSHSLFLTNGGVVYSCGNNSFGAIGNANSGESFRPQIISGLSGARIVKINCGRFHSLALTEEGRVFAFGKARDGQLGLGDKNLENQFVPKIITELLGTKIVDISGGRKESFLLASDGRVWACGSSELVQSSSPIIIEELFGATKIICGSVANFALFGPKNTVSTLSNQEGVYFLHEEDISRIESFPENELVSLNEQNRLVELVELTFSFAGAVNGSFLDPESSFATNNDSPNESLPGIDFRRAFEFMSKLEKIGGAKVGDCLQLAWSRLIRNSIDLINQKSAENLRVFLLAFFSPIMMRFDFNNFIIDRFLVSFLNLRPRATGILMHWIQKSQIVYKRMKLVLQSYLAWVSNLNWCFI